MKELADKKSKGLQKATLPETTSSVAKVQSAEKWRKWEISFAYDMFIGWPDIPVCKNCPIVLRKLFGIAECHGKC